MTRGILLKIAATFVFTLMSVMAKLSNGRYVLSEITLFRSSFALLIIGVWLLIRHDWRHDLQTSRPWGHLLRGSFGSGGMYFNFGALALLPLPMATAIGFASPLITVVLAALILHERVRLYRWSAVLVGFGGVLIMVWENVFGASGASPAASLGVGVAVIGTVFTASAVIQTRRLTTSEGTATIVFYFMATATLVSLAVLVIAALWPPQFWGSAVISTQQFIMPNARDGLTLAAIGVFGGLGQILMTESYRHADASIIACFDYTSMIWALIMGYALFGELASLEVLAGAAIVCGAGIFVIWRENRLGLARAHASKVA